MRHKEPLRPLQNGEVNSDERDNIIQKLRQQLITARGKDKQTGILKQHLSELSQRCKIIETANVRISQELSHSHSLLAHSVSELKKEQQNCKKELKNAYQELSQHEQFNSNLQKQLKIQIVDVEKLKKEGYHLSEDGQKLTGENIKSKIEQQALIKEFKRVQFNKRQINDKKKEISEKMEKTKIYIQDLETRQKQSVNKLKSYEQLNTDIEQQIEKEEQFTEKLEQAFNSQHERIKSQVEEYLNLQHKQEKLLQETKHTHNLHRSEIEKQAELNSMIKNVKKATEGSENRRREVEQQSEDILRQCEDFCQKNRTMSEDMKNLKLHLQNVMKQNREINEELEKYMSEDQKIIELIIKKWSKLAPERIQRYK